MFEAAGMVGSLMAAGDRAGYGRHDGHSSLKSDMSRPFGERTVDWCENGRGLVFLGFGQSALTDQYFVGGVDRIEPGRDAAIGCRMQQGGLDLLHGDPVV